MNLRKSGASLAPRERANDAMTVSVSQTLREIYGQKEAAGAAL